MLKCWIVNKLNVCCYYYFDSKNCSKLSVINNNLCFRGSNNIILYCFRLLMIKRGINNVVIIKIWYVI